MSKIHLRVSGVRSQGQTEFEYGHQAACGYVRDNVTSHAVFVDCKLCLNAIKRQAPAQHSACGTKGCPYCDR